MSVTSYMIGFIKGSINNTIESGIDIHSFLIFPHRNDSYKMGEVLCHRIKIFGCLICIAKFLFRKDVPM